MEIQVATTIMLSHLAPSAAIGEPMCGRPAIGLFPTNYSVLLTGPPGVGKFEYFLELVKQGLEQRKRIVFVTLDIHPSEVRERAKVLNLNLEDFEERTFIFVDCYSAMSSDKMDRNPQKKMYQVSSFSNLEGIGMAIAKASNELKTPVMIFFYTVSTLFLHNSQQAIAKFMQIVTSRVKTSLGFIGYAVHDGVHDQMTMNLLRSLVDGVIEARFNEDLGREVRIHHMRGLQVGTSWSLVDQPIATKAEGVRQTVVARRNEL
jgi:KaiC/GvpD/RAD55 family RecA-like ATPase